MSELNLISAETRGNTGKGHSRRLRIDGRMPAIIYGGTNDPVEISLSTAEFIKEFKRPGFFTRLYDLTINQETFRVLPIIVGKISTSRRCVLMTVFMGLVTFNTWVTSTQLKDIFKDV